MRIPIISIFLLSMLVASSCKRDEFSIPKPSHLAGYASGTKNGKPWKGYCQAVDLHATSTGDIRLNLSGFYDTINWYLVETLYMGGLSPCVCTTSGFIPIDNPAAGLPQTPWMEYGVLEIDVIRAIFNPDTTASNFVEFTSIDTVAGTCSGKFSCTVVNKYPDLGYPDSVYRFENCTFSTRIK